MILRFPYNQFVLLKHATTMYKYVSFYGITKTLLLPDKMKLFELVDRKLIEATDHIDLTEDELNLLVSVLQTDIRACGENDSESSNTDYRVHFDATREDVLGLLNELLACRR